MSCTLTRRVRRSPTSQSVARPRALQPLQPRSQAGATTRQRGRFELAHTGTIFLADVGALPLQVQKRLLRVLYDRDMERLGGSTAIVVDVRIIAATTDDLTRAIAEGRFREDLYERLNVIALNLPPLLREDATLP